MKHIGLDVGNGSTCLFVRPENGQPLWNMYASTYGIYDQDKGRSVVGVKVDTQDEAPPHVFSLHGRKYVLGYNAIQATGSKPFSTYGREERIHLDAYQTLSKLALLDAATMDGSTGTIEVSLGFSVPNEDFREVKLQRLKDLFAEPVVGTKNGEQVVVMVKEFELISQPIAVLLDAYYDTDGFVRHPSLENEDVLVIDSGSGTLDMTEFSRMRLQKQVGDAIGMNDVYQMIVEDIEQREPKVRVDAYDLESQLRSQLDPLLHHQSDEIPLVYRYGTLAIPIADIYHKAMNDVWVTMVGRIERRYPDRTRFHRILLGGGTGDAFSSYFNEWMPQIQKAIDPQLAIARGVCKYVISLSSEQAETALAAD